MTQAIFPHSFINMGKIRENRNQMRENCVELHKSGNGYKIIATCLKKHISNFREILKKFKSTGTVTNLPGRGPMFILPPRTVRRMISVVTVWKPCLKKAFPVISPQT